MGPTPGHQPRPISQQCARCNGQDPQHRNNRALARRRRGLVLTLSENQKGTSRWSVAQSAVRRIACIFPRSVTQASCLHFFGVFGRFGRQGCLRYKFSDSLIVPNLEIFVPEVSGPLAAAIESTAAAQATARPETLLIDLSFQIHRDFSYRPSQAYASPFYSRAFDLFFAREQGLSGPNRSKSSLIVFLPHPPLRLSGRPSAD